MSNICSKMIIFKYLGLFLCVKMGNRVQGCFGKKEVVAVMVDSTELTDAILKQNAITTHFSEVDFSEIGNPKGNEDDCKEV